MAEKGCRLGCRRAALLNVRKVYNAKNTKKTKELGEGPTGSWLNG